MSLKIRRGLESDRLSITPEEGEYLYTIDTKKVYIGDGTTAGGNLIGAGGSVTSIATSSPLTGGTITTSGTIGISQANSTTNGYLSSTDWNTFNNKLGSVPSLQDVTDVGNTTTNDIYVNSLFLYNPSTSTYGTNIGLNNTYDILISSWAGASDYIISSLKLDDTRTYYLPNASGTIPLKVNGQSADNAGAITIPVGTGTVTGVTATSPIISSGGTAPVISTSMSTNKLIGRSSAGTGVMEEITIGTGLSLSGGTLSSTSTGGGLSHGIASGTDTYTVSITGVASYTDGDAYLIRFTNGNTGTSTLNINSLGAVTLYRNNDGALLGGDIVSGGEMLCVYNSSNTTFQCIGISPNSLFAYVTNDDSVTITKGMPVYAFSGTGDRMTVKRAFNTSDATSAQTVGLVFSSSIAAGQKGLIMIQGLLDGLSILPTSTFSDGDPIYLGSTAGTITNVKPYAPLHLVYLGVVTTASPGSAGRMYVRVQNGYELDELHNVQAQTPTYKDTLWYDNTVSPAQWKTASISTILGYTPITRSVNSVSSPTTAGATTATDYVYLVSGSTTITLPTAVGNTNRYTIKNVGTNTVSIATTSSQTIDGSASPININVQYVALDLISDGTNWNII